MKAATRRAGKVGPGTGRSGRRSSASRHRASGYLAESERPWASLLFVLPLVVAYGLHSSGLLHSSTAATSNSSTQITAFVLIEELFSLFGAAGRHLPAFALVGMLLAAHLIRKDPWRLKLATIPAMLAESVVWSLPLVIIGWAVARFLPLSPVESHRDVVFLCVGAGIYEELLFRLLVVTALSLIFRDLFQIPVGWAWTINLILSGLLFSLYHYLSPFETFQWRVFLFRTLAGVYLGLLFVVRGYGITAGCHAAYDMFVLGVFSS